MQPLGGRARRLLAAGWIAGVPNWAVLVFSATIGLAYAPGVWEVHGIHGDYELLFYYRGSGFFHPEASHLATIGRPVAALLTNLTVLPIHSLADIRWVRIFSILTLCLIGIQMMSSCIVRLRTTTRDAVAVALATFLIPPFIYSISNPSAWATHLFTMVIALGAYAILGRSNLQAIPFIELVRRREWSSLPRQIRAYVSQRQVLFACLVYQLALYDYPPTALVLATFPVIVLLFSGAPSAYRILIAFRDILFIGVNLALYAGVVKLIYLPICSLFVDKPAASEDPFLLRLTAVYQFKLTTDPVEVVARIGRVARVAGDLWFLPQYQGHVMTAAVILLAVAFASGTTFFVRRTQSGIEASLARLRIGTLTSFILMLVVGSCFALSASAVLTSAGGFIAYRTIALSIALVAIVFIYCLGGSVELLWGIAAGSRSAAARAATGATTVAVAAALAGSFYANYATMKLASNEFTYFTDVVKQAIAAKAKTIFFLDARPLTLPEDNPVIYDRQGRAVPPYEVGCLSAYCMQSGAIMQIASEELGRPPREFEILVPRGDYPVPGLTCPMLTSPVPSFPPGASAKVVATIKYYRSFPSIFCTTYDPAWHDLGYVGKR